MIIMKLTIICVSLLTLFLNANAASLNEGDSKISYSMPKSVRSVFLNKCFDCHNQQSKSDKAREALNFSTLDQLNKFKLIAKFNESAKEIEEVKMPPRKFVDKHPEADLQVNERKLLLDWIKKETTSLLKK